MPKRTPKPEATVTDLRDVREATDASGIVVKSPNIADVGKPKRRKQGELPGLEKESIKELDELLELFAEKTSQLSALRVEVGQLKVNIIQTAEKHDVKNYRNETADPPLLLTITERDVAVKVRPVGGELGEDASEGDDE